MNKKSTKKEIIIYGIGIILIVIFLIYILPIISEKILRPVIQGVIENLTGNLGQIETYSILAILSLFSIFYLVGLFLISSFSKNRKWFKLTILTMIFLLIAGFLLIDIVIGNPKLSLNLLEEGKTKVGEIKCKGISGPLIEGDSIFCNIKLEIEFTQLNKTIAPTIKDRGTLIRDFSDNNFYAEKGIEYISFRFIGIDNEGKLRNIHVGWPFTPLTEDEFKKNRERFLAALMGLFLLIFVTVPIAMINIRDLWENTK